MSTFHNKMYVIIMYIANKTAQKQVDSLLLGHDPWFLISGSCVVKQYQRSIISYQALL